MVAGTVQWFDSKRGFGFLMSDYGDHIFVDIQNINNSGLDILISGQRLQFDIHKDSANNKAAAARNIKLLNDLQK